MLETCINIISSLRRSFNLFMLKESGLTLKKLSDFKKKNSQLLNHCQSCLVLRFFTLTSLQGISRNLQVLWTLCEAYVHITRKFLFQYHSLNFGLFEIRMLDIYIYINIVIKRQLLLNSCTKFRETLQVHVFWT